MKTTERTAKSVAHAYRLMAERAPMDPTPVPDEAAVADETMVNADSVVTAFMDEFQGDLIETMRLLAKASAGEFESNRDSLFSRIENLLRNQMIRGLTAQVLVGREDNYDVA